MHFLIIRLRAASNHTYRLIILVILTLRLKTSARLCYMCNYLYLCTNWIFFAFKNNSLVFRTYSPINMFIPSIHVIFIFVNN